MNMPVRVNVRDEQADPDAVLAWLRRVDARFSPYRADSEITRIDRGELDPADAHPDVREVLARCDALRGPTRGFFDARATGRLDPSGFVKGWAVDRAAELLDAAGSRDWCIDAGGDVRVAGGPWRIGVRHPRRRGRLAAILKLRAGAVATSAAYERGAHVVAPRTGRAPSGIDSVTVVGPELGVADAYATAAFAMGARGPAWTTGLGGFEAMTIRGGRTLATPGFTRHCAGATPARTLPAGRGWSARPRA
jgi:thiamine biosynthesis lipoprotein